MKNGLNLCEFVSFDPAVRGGAGVALWREGQLVTATAIKLPASEAPMGARCLAVAALAAAWLDRQCAVRVAVLVFEWPQVYSVGKSKVPPASLVPLAGVGMALAGILSCRGPLVVRTYLPAEWTPNAGTKSTKVREFETSMRTGRIRKRLSAAELAAIAGCKSHDTMDAVGIGLHALGRLEPIRVFTGAVD